jgi:MHS family alpha-ketoglutarate permease-like MFS transporter
VSIPVEQAKAAELIASAAPRTRVRSILVGTVGNFVEFFDWTIYAYMAPIFSHAYFPTTDPRVSLLLAFSVWALGAVTRPLGALVFGVYSDRMGRRNAITISILGMAFSCLMIAACPDYATVGVAAPAVLILARLMQGVCAGGEGGSAVTYLIEFAQPGRRATVASLQQFSTGTATLAALSVSALLTVVLSAEALGSWGWRVPFVLGGAMGLVGLYLRATAAETPIFVAEAASAERRPPVLKGLAAEWKLLVLSASMAVFPSVSYLNWQIYLPTFLTTAVGLSGRQSFWCGIAGVLVFLVLLVPMAKLSDRIGRKPMLIAYATGGLAWSLPTYLLLPQAPSLAFALTVSVVGNVLLAIMAGALVSAMSEVFSTRARATGFGLAYAIALILTGSTFPPAVTALVSERNFVAIVAFVGLWGAISLIAYIVMPETRRRELAG